MSEWIKAILLGIVEGITEFLPVSSTGHLIIASALLDFQPHLRMTFTIFIQIGAVIAVIALYRAELLRQLRTVWHDPQVQRLWLALVVAFLPFAIIGFLVRSWMASLFSTPVVLISMIVGGVLMLLVEATYRRRLDRQGPASAESDLETVTLRQALVVGFAQVLAIIPGMSRSATSIIGGMAAGMDRRTATQFSFFLAIPTLGAATLVELAGALDDIEASEFGLLIIGTAVSAVVAWLAVRWLIRYVSRHSFVPFGIYRVVIGGALLLLVILGVLRA